jgi:hypothetical protein
VTALRSWEQVANSVLWPGSDLCGPNPETNRRYFALAHVLQCLPEHVLSKLENKADDFVWFIPDAAVGGRIVPFPCTMPAEGTRVPMAKVIYLGPALERRNVALVIAAVAHELAHVLLGHELFTTPDQYKTQEQAAWKAVIKWGFAKEARAHKKWYINYHRNQRYLEASR